MEDIHAGKTLNTPKIHVEDSIALLANVNFKLNMKRRELINTSSIFHIRSYVSMKLNHQKVFKDDLSKYLKDIVEAKKEGCQMEKKKKTSGTYRMILNIKTVNEFVLYYHYIYEKDNIQTALKLMRPGCFMTSAILKNAYYLVVIESEDR